MRKRNLVICPNCQNKGITQVLGEIDDFGHFLVMRFHKGITRIIGGKFTVACGVCGELVYIKQERKQDVRANVRYWFYRICRIKPNQGSQALEA